MNLGPGLNVDAETARAQLHKHIRFTKQCWLWTGYKKNGYGCVRLCKRQFYAHRVMYLLHNKRPLKDRHVCHKCDRPSCVRPDHLFAGTHRDNMIDMWRKGRASPPPHFFGEEHPLTKFKWRDIQEMRRLERTESQRSIARRFKTSQPVVQRILRNKVWNRRR